MDFPDVCKTRKHDTHIRKQSGQELQDTWLPKWRWIELVIPVFHQIWTSDFKMTVMVKRGQNNAGKYGFIIILYSQSMYCTSFNKQSRLWLIIKWFSPYHNKAILQLISQHLRETGSFIFNSQLWTGLKKSVGSILYISYKYINVRTLGQEMRKTNN